MFFEIIRKLLKNYSKVLRFNMDKIVFIFNCCWKNFLFFIYLLYLVLFIDIYKIVLVICIIGNISFFSYS